jgi:hypothetical protein
MRRFAEIFAVAAERKGGVAALEDILAKTAPRPPPEIAAMQDGRILAEMTRRIFYAGFSSPNERSVDDENQRWRNRRRSAETREMAAWARYQLEK